MIETFVREIGGWAASQLEACTRCGLCSGACPFFDATGDPEYAPVWKLELLRRAYEQRFTPVGKLKTALGIEKRVTEADLRHWCDLNFGGCSTCNRCSFTCPMGIAVGPLLHTLRDRLAEAGALPDNLVTMRETVARESNVFGYPAYERAGWVEYMTDAPDDLYQRERAEVVYFVGCVTSFEPRAQRIAESFARLLTAANVNFTILGAGEVCCGFPLRAAGLKAQAESLIHKNAEAVRATGANTVVFTCPACRLMWLDEYAPHLPQVRLLHSTELLAELIEADRLELHTLTCTVTYHDPCDLARTGGVYEAPREVLKSVPGLRLIEVSERRESGLCCGGGGNVEMVAPQRVKQVANKTVTRLMAPNAEILATACPQCVRILEESIKQVKPTMRVMDVAELVARAIS
ncbi:MAG TPA: (Fe-S)-binding protein [Anaerolineales bacterium]|nr:(Fe-S)-binding protein [Anaerolineales bacterium]